jgi:predicted DNA-binding protein (MmcQ/YjbR family)
MSDGAKLKPDLAKLERTLADHAASFPEVAEEAPWGHRAFKVKGKTFLFMASEGGVLSLSMKLPGSGALALELPFAEPTGYGLGKSGWVSARFSSGRNVPVPMLQAWIDESYRAIAPKKLVALLSGEKAEPKAKRPAKKLSKKRASPRSR